MKKRGFIRLFYAFLYSLNGIRFALKECAFRQALFLAILLIPTALYIPVSCPEKGILIGAIFLVLIIELLNTSIEIVTDYLFKEKHDIAKSIKDIASAAVFLSLLGCFLTWTLILWKFWR